MNTYLQSQYEGEEKSVSLKVSPGEVGVGSTHHFQQSFLTLDATVSHVCLCVWHKESEQIRTVTGII